MKVSSPDNKNGMHKVFAFIVALLTFALAGQYAFINYATYGTEYENQFSTKFLAAARNLVSHPFNAVRFGSQYWGGDSMAVVIVIAGVLIIALIYADYTKKKDQHKGVEKGSAKWNNGKKFRKIYSYTIETDCRNWAKAKGKKAMKVFSGIVEAFYYLIYRLTSKFIIYKKANKELKDEGIKMPNRLFKVFAKATSLLESYEPAEDDPEPGNMIFSAFVRFNMNKRSNLNNNVLVVGGPGTGKSRGIVIPNILQHNTSFVVTDPKGELLYKTGESLRKAGYHVKCFNLDEKEYSCGYNPFRYIRSDDQVLVLVDCLIKNTVDSKAGKGDLFFAKAEQALFLAIFYYIYYFCTDEEKNMRQVMILLSEAEVNEQDRNFKSKLDKRFDEVKNGTGRAAAHGADPNHVCVRSYNIFKQGTGKTAKSILISAQVRLAPFNIAAVENLTMHDDVHLEEIGDSKQALFVIIPSGETSFNFLASMMYTQLFSTLYKQCGIDNINTHQLVKDNVCALRSGLFKSKRTEEEELNKAEELRQKYIKYSEDIVQEMRGNEDAQYPIWLLKDEKGKILREFQSEKERDLYVDALKNGKWKHGDRNTTIPVHFILDEFKNTGTIPDFDQYLSTMRSYHISCTIILQSLDQLKSMYEDDWGTLIGDCSTKIFLGSTNLEDQKYFSEVLGSATQSVTSVSTGGGNKNDSKSISRDEFTLMRPEQLGAMPSSDCIVMISGLDPFYDKKFILESHRNYGTMEESYDHHLHFQIPDYRSIMPIPVATDDRLVAEKQAGKTRTEVATPGVSDFKKKREQNLQKISNSPVGIDEAAAAAASAKKMPALVDCLNMGTAKMANLKPLTREPFPQPKVDLTKPVAALSPEDSKIMLGQDVEVVMMGDDGYIM